VWPKVTSPLQELEVRGPDTPDAPQIHRIHPDRPLDTPRIHPWIHHGYALDTPQMHQIHP
jgi:hypothetical protein